MVFNLALARTLEGIMVWIRTRLRDTNPPIQYGMLALPQEQSH